MMRRKLLPFCLVLMFAVAAPLRAEVYTYRDSSGMVYYVDDLGKIPARYRSAAKTMDELPAVNSIEESAPEKVDKPKTPRANRSQKVKERFSGTIELYVTAWCPYCRNAEKYLKKMNYPYVKYDVEKDAGANERAAQYPGKGVPLIIVGNRNFRGFSPEILEAYMEQ